MSNENDTAIDRVEMIETLQRLGITNDDILDVMARIPRHHFVPTRFMSRAYEDAPVPIGHEQTISQPYMVALMTQSLALTGREKVLEIGTGSGYQTAVLASLTCEVYTIERIADLSRQAEERLTHEGYRNIHFRTGDGSLGWPDNAPFDCILAAASCPDAPATWKDQLAEGGRLVAPVGALTGQTLMLYTREGGCVREESICGCVFVPLLGEFGWQL